MADVVMDHRERCPEIVQSLTDVHGLHVELKQLSLGDYFLEPKTLVERKSARDFCISLVDGRLFRQCNRLVKSEWNTFLIIEGDVFEPGFVSQNAIKGALITIAYSFQLPTLFTDGPCDTAWHLAALRQRKRAVCGKRGPQTAGYRPKKLATQKDYVLRAIPGVGPKLSKTLLGHYGRIDNIVAASERELAQVPGINKKTAKKIVDVLHEGEGVYRGSAKRRHPNREAGAPGHPPPCRPLLDA